MKIRYLIIIPVLLSLVGCASDSKRIVDLNLNYINAKDAPVNSGDANAQAEIANAASSVDNSLQQLSAMQMSQKPNTKAHGMDTISSVDWNGPVQPILQKIAHSAGYRLRVLGTKPAIPALVDISESNQRLSDILRNVTYQVSKKATVTVYPKTHIIELRYKQN